MKTKPNKDPNPLTYLIGKSWHYSRGNRKAVVVYWLMYIIVGLLDLLVLPLSVAKIMMVVQEQGITAESISTLLLLLLVLLLNDIACWALHGPARVIERKNAFLVRSNYRNFLMRGVMNMPLDWHTEHHSGDTIDKVNKGTQALYDFSGNTFENIYALVKLFGSYIMLGYFFPMSMTIVLPMTILTGWIIARFDHLMMGQYKQLNKAENKVTESTVDAISNITTVIILRVERIVFDALMHKVMAPFKLYKKNSKINEIKWFLTSLCCMLTIGMVLGAYFLTHIGSSGAAITGAVYLLWRYLGNMSELFEQFATQFSNLVKRMSQVMNSEELSKDFTGETFANHVLPLDWQNLNIAGLSFSYDGGSDGPAQLDNVSLDLKKGEKVAIVGESGSGKTTLLKIIRDLHHPQALRLSVDGVPVTDGFAGIARAIALVPQSPELFAITILENITLGAEYDLEVVLRFVEMACFTEVLAGLPKGLESSIKEKGVNLSGGQQQRLALARGLLASMDKDIVLLDEPTSSLDTATENHVYRNIFREFAGKTIVSSIHRLHLLRQFDRICVFDKGRIIATGTLDELLAHCTIFQAMWEEYSVHQS